MLMRERPWMAVGVALLAAGLVGCGADASSRLSLVDGRAILHEDASGWVVDGTVSLMVFATDDTETWLMSLGLQQREDPDDPEDLLLDVTAKPISSFPLITQQRRTSAGLVQFHGRFPSSAWKEGDCADAPSLWVTAEVYDTASLDELERFGYGFGYQVTVDPAGVELTCVSGE